MIRVLLADDEPLFREYLRKIVDWESLGFEIVAVAKNGEEVLEQTRQKGIDIYFLDINMPRLDGLALTAQLKKLCPHAMVVFVTGYSTFEYAKEAIHLGVEAYLLKPFSAEELTETLTQLKKKFFSHLDKQKHEDFKRAIVSEHLWYRLLSGNSRNTDALKQQFRDNNLHFCSDVFLVCAVKIDRLYETIPAARDIALWEYGIINVMNEVITLEGAQFLCKVPEHYVVSILNFADRKAAGQFQRQQFRTLCDIIQQTFGFSISVGIGSLVTGLANIQDSYSNAIAVLQQTSMTKTSYVTCIEDLQPDMVQSGFYSLKTNELLLQALRKTDFSEVQNILCAAQGYIVEHNIPSDFVFTIWIGILSVCFSYIVEMGKSLEDVLPPGESPYNTLTSCQSVESGFHYLLGLYHQTIRYFSNIGTSHTSAIIQQVIQYIEDCYQNEDLTVERISKHFFLDQSYLRRLFSKQMNETILGIIISMRMNKASQLILCGMPLKDVAQSVGYRDYGYFCKCFKKYFAITPGQYQKNASALQDKRDTKEQTAR